MDALCLLHVVWNKVATISIGYSMYLSWHGVVVPELVVHLRFSATFGIALDVVLRIVESCWSVSGRGGGSKRHSWRYVESFRGSSCITREPHVSD